MLLGFLTLIKWVNSYVSCTLSLPLIAITSPIRLLATRDTRQRAVSFPLSEGPLGKQKGNSQEDQHNCCLRGSKAQAPDNDAANEHRKRQFSIPKGAEPLPTVFPLENWCGSDQRVRETDKGGTNTWLSKALGIRGGVSVRTWLFQAVSEALKLHLPNVLLEQLQRSVAETTHYTAHTSTWHYYQPLEMQTFQEHKHSSPTHWFCYLLHLTSFSKMYSTVWLFINFN